MIINFRNLSRIICVIILIIFSIDYIFCQCECVKREIEEELNLVTEVFVGKVIGKRINREKPIRSNKDYIIKGIRNEIEIIKEIKGNLKNGEIISILTGNGETDCGYVFKLNENYLIYSRYWFTDQCRRTKKLGNNNDEEYQYLVRDSNVNILPAIRIENTSLTELEYIWQIRKFGPIINFKRCDRIENHEECLKNIFKEISEYFDREISERKIIQIIELRIDDKGIIRSYKFTSKKGELTDQEQEDIIGFIKTNYEFVTSGYREILSNGIMMMILEN